MLNDLHEKATEAIRQKKETAAAERTRHQQYIAANKVRLCTRIKDVLQQQAAEGCLVPTYTFTDISHRVVSALLESWFEDEPEWRIPFSFDNLEVASADVRKRELLSDNKRTTVWFDLREPLEPGCYILK